MDLPGEEDDLGGLIHHHHGEAEQDQAASQQDQGLDRFVHQRSVPRPPMSGDGKRQDPSSRL